MPGRKRRLKSTGGMSSEITTSRVPTLLLGEEGNIRRSANCELLDDLAESKNLECVETLQAIHVLFLLFMV